MAGGDSTHSLAFSVLDWTLVELIPVGVQVRGVGQVELGSPMAQGVCPLATTASPATTKTLRMRNIL